MEKHGDMEIHFIIKLLRGYLQKVGCNKKYKNVLNSVIIDYFVHYQKFLTIISYINTASTPKKKVIEVIQYLESFLNSR